MAAKKETTIQLEITFEEANTILEALGQMPFMRVYKLIEKIHVQAQANAPVKASRTKKK